MSSTASWHVPAHVPPERVVDFDLFAIDPGLTDPVDKWQALRHSGVPAIFWSPRNGGHWTLLDYDDIREAYRDYTQFSNRDTPIPPVDGWPVFQPQSVDPPDHAKFRSLLAPLFTPAAVRRLEGEVRRRAALLIEGFVADGRCDFVADFSAQLPSGMFIHLMGMDEARVPEFVALADTFMRVSDADGKLRNVADIYAVLEEIIAAKRRQPPAEDVLSALLGAREADGTPFPHQEIIDCVFLLFVAGLDTVTSTLTYIWRYLARSPQARDYIAAHLDQPAELSSAVEELFRINAVSNIYRRVAKDIVYKNIAMKEGDKVVLPNTVANRDPKVFDNPQLIDLERRANAHVTFGLGPHRCLGSHLAKVEVIASLREWLPRIPEFRLDDTAALDIFAGPVMGFRQLPLLWER
jgi:cytochrome P450